MPLLPDIPWVGRVDSWRRALTDEVIALPSTLQTFREGVDNFQRITARLLDATDALEQLAHLHLGDLTNARRQMEDINRLVRDQASPAADLVLGAVGGLSDALASMARMNPMARPPSPRPGSPSATDDDEVSDA